MTVTQRVQQATAPMREALTGYIPQENVDKAMKAIEWMVIKGFIAQEDYVHQFAEYVPNATDMLIKAVNADYKALKSWMEGQRVATSDVLPKLIELIEAEKMAIR